ncbi:MAG: cell division protein ZapB [Deltaproteobacteria bacterium]|jgi:FtsZ-binding cell division protein ZapB|nr:cell division protein ZapB [Deltaproteobacteria bacterium]
MDFAKFELLEKKVTILLEKKAAAEKQNQTLGRELETVKSQLEEAKKRIAALVDERRLVLERVDALLGRLE